MPTVLYVEDSPEESENIQSLFRHKLPKVRLIPALSLDQAINLAQPVLGDLRIVFVDGNLSEVRNESPVRYGWEVIETLKGMGFDGRSVYTGTTRLPDNKRPLFDEVITKNTPSDEEYENRIIEYVQQQLT